MANRYWVGGTGDWSDTSHWSLTSGGVGGQAVPTSVDDVFIDDNSGESGFVLNCDISVYFKDFLDSRVLVWVFKALANRTWNVYGNITTSEASNINGMGAINVKVTNKTINFKGITEFLYFEDNTNVEVEIKGNLNCSKSTTPSFFDSSGSGLTLSGEAIFKIYDIGKNTLTNQNWTLNDGVLESNRLTDADISTLNLNAGTSTLRLLDSSVNFESGSLTWHNVDLQGDNITINGSPTFNQLKGVSGQTINVQAGQTITLSDLDIDGCSLIGL